MTTIIVPKRRELVVNPKAHHPIAGRYHGFTLTKADAHGRPIRGTTRPALVRSLDGELRPAGPAHNLITNYGMDQFATATANTQLFGYCRVGTGTTAPDFTDLALDNHRAASNSWPSTGDAYEIRRNIASAPYWYEVDVRRSFAAGAASGNLTEIGMSAAATGNTLMSRALITDINGDPAALTVGADEILEVTYTWRVYIPTADVTGTTTIKGNNYDWTLRPCAIHQSGASVGTPGWPAQETSLNNGATRGPRAYCLSSTSNPTSNYSSAVSNGTSLVALDEIAIGPSGTTPASRQISATSNAAYTPGSHYLDVMFEWALDRANDAALGLWQFSISFGSFQFCLDGDTVSKDATERMRMVLGVSWGRYTP